MIAELGHLALAIALALALVQGTLPLVGAQRGHGAWMALARPAAWANAVFVAFAYGALTWSFLVTDFSVAYVAANANRVLPWYYRVTAVWGGHEGSMLLWTLVLGLWMAAVAAASRSLPQALVARVLAVMGLISAGFLLFMLATSNPFARLAPAPLDGADLNPLLQDIGMIMHPPMLYMGYVGLSVSFAFAIAALIGGRLDAAWARWARPWVSVAWIFLTIGVTLGSWWAYYELGWGGWWFWDPVENASFMPWLVATALIHSLAATEKRGVFKSWTVLLALTAFALSLLGTFIVRSGVLTSVHSFATDPARGVYILAFLALVIGASLVLYAVRGPGTLGGARFEAFSRETFLLGNNVILVVAMLTVLLGTLYPLAAEALGAGKLSVGPPYFNLVFVPLMVLLLALLGVGCLVRYKRDRAARLLRPLAYGGAAAAALGITAAAMLGAGGVDWAVGAGLALALWVVVTNVEAVREQLSGQRRLAGALARLPAGVYAMTLAHIGLAVAVVGITVSSAYASELRLRMAPGESASIAGYDFRFAGVERQSGANYDAAVARLVVTRDGEAVTTLAPEKRFYASGGQPMTEAGIDPGLSRDLYAALGESLGADGAWSLRLYHKPFVRWIWLGGALMALGGAVALADRRYRGARTRTAPAAATAARA